MAKEELIEFEGLVTEILPDTRYRVKLDTGHEIIAYTAGKMKKNRIKTLAGDRVIVEMSPYDLEKGRIIFRHKDDRAATLARPRCANSSAAARLPPFIWGHRVPGHPSSCLPLLSRLVVRSSPQRHRAVAWFESNDIAR